MQRPIKLCSPWDADQLSRLLGDLAARRLAPWLYLRCQEEPGELGPEILARLRQTHLAALRQELLQEQELFHVLRALNRHSIPVIPLKGTLLGQRLHGLSGTRPSADLDLLVHTADLAQAGRLLEDEGYRCVGETTRDVIYQQPGTGDVPWCVEIKHTLGFFSRTARAWQQGVWDRTTQNLINGVNYLAMDRADEFIYLCLNLVKDRFDSPASALDIHLAYQNWSDLDWTSIMQRAEDAGLGLYVAVASHYSTHWFETELPTPVRLAMSDRLHHYFERWEWSGALSNYLSVFPLSKHMHILWHLLLLSSSWHDRRDHMANCGRTLMRRLRRLQSTSPAGCQNQAQINC
jgi:hypothetical protein